LAPETVDRVGKAAAAEVFRSWKDVVEEVRERYAALLTGTAEPGAGG
jgi:hypothetical protein